MVTLKIGDQDTDFMVDTGAELSVVTKPVAPLFKRSTAVTGFREKKWLSRFSSPGNVRWGGHKVTHEFLYIPECPVPLLGRDLLSKLGAQVTFSPEERPLFGWAQQPTYSPSLCLLKTNGGYMILLEINKTRQQSWIEGKLSCSLRSGLKITLLG